MFSRAGLAIFVDGCFWHRCPTHATAPKKNGVWWADKLQANVDRDARQTAELRDSGWVVLRFWEHEDPERAADVIEQTYRSLVG